MLQNYSLYQDFFSQIIKKQIQDFEKELIRANLRIWDGARNRKILVEMKRAISDMQRYLQVLGEIVNQTHNDD